MARIGEWAPLASRFAGIANAFAGPLKVVAGLADRPVPKFSTSTFRSRFKGDGKGERVVLFDDTFNNHFRPQTAAAAQRVLADAGCAVELPPRHVCCGRPYYDYGMLDEAKAALERVRDVLAPQVEAGVPVVVLEPGCLSVFRDEMRQILPKDEGAARLAAAVTSLGELLKRRSYSPKVAGPVFVHSHCHQKALWGAGADLALLQGAEVIAPDTGCCGMSGSYGYRAQTAEVSKRIARLALLPALQAAPQALVMASGFSCREQIETLAGRPTLHLAELLLKGVDQ